MPGANGATEVGRKLLSCDILHPHLAAHQFGQERFTQRHKYDLLNSRFGNGFHGTGVEVLLDPVEFPGGGVWVEDGTDVRLGVAIFVNRDESISLNFILMLDWTTKTTFILLLRGMK